MLQSSVSQLRLSVVQAKELIDDALHVVRESIVNACQEYEELGGLATAKLKRKEEGLELAHPPESGTCANSLAIHAVWFVEIACITAGKSVPLQREWCGHQRTPRRLCPR